MAVEDVGQKFFKGETGRNTRGLLRLIILVTIAAAAISSRLFSVIRFESIIHECERDICDFGYELENVTAQCHVNMLTFIL